MMNTQMMQLMMQLIGVSRAMATELEQFHFVYGSERHMDAVIDDALKAAAALEKVISEQPTDNATHVSERLCRCTKGC